MIGNMKNAIHKIVCGSCGITFNSSWNHTKTCSSKCRKNRSNSNSGRTALVNKDISAGTVGAISELKVVAYLLSNGYAVFHAASPSCFCDIVAIKDGKTFYIEARTGYRNFNGSMAFPTNVRERQGRPDIFAVVERNTGKVFFYNVKDTVREGRFIQKTEIEMP